MVLWAGEWPPQGGWNSMLGRQAWGREGREGKGKGRSVPKVAKAREDLGPFGAQGGDGKVSEQKADTRKACGLCSLQPRQEGGTQSPRTPACNPSWGGVGLPGAAGQRQGWRPLNTDGAPPRARLSRGPHRVSEPAGTPPEEHPGCSLSGGGTPLNGLLCSSPSLTGLPPQPILQMRKSRFRIVKSEGPQRKPLFLASGPALGTQ